ncbi:MAG: ABC transporter substrate-binding protein [Patescibacteria group bacterium]
MSFAKRLRQLIGVVIFLVVYGAVPRSLQATISPTEEVKETIEKVFALLQDPALKGGAKKAERGALLRAAVKERFDFREIAKRALGIHWKQSMEKQDAFVALFSELLFTVYLDTLEGDIKATITYLREHISEGSAEVVTRIMVSDKGNLNKGFDITYRLHEREGSWKAYDILVEGMSLIQNYRSQFYHMLQRRSFDEVLEIMRKKIKKLQNARAATPLDGEFFWLLHLRLAKKKRNVVV